MRQRTALIMAMVLTSFMLAITAAVIARFTLDPTGGGVSGTAPLASAPTVSPNAAEYQQALQTANAQLEQANRQLEEAYRRLTAEPGTAVSTTPVTTSATLFVKRSRSLLNIVC